MRWGSKLLSAALAIGLALCAGRAQAASTINALQQGTFPFPDPSCAGTGTPSVNLWIAENGVDKRTPATQIGYMFQGTLAPACPFTYEMWWNTAGSPGPQLKVFTTTGGSAVMGAIDATNNLWVPPIGGGVLTTVAGAATVNLGAVNSSVVEISGSAAISSFGSSAVIGSGRTVRFSGASTLTYNAGSMILPSASDITTLPGDTLFAIYLGSGNWLVSEYQSAINNPISTISITTDHTATSSDCGYLLNVSGGTHTITVQAASNYPTGCQFFIYDSNASSAVNVTLPGPVTKRLYPGQTERVYSSSGAMVYTGLHPYVTPGITLYVDSVTGLDTNDGLLVSTPLRLIATAITRLCSDFDLQGTNPHIQLADAISTDYRENIGVFGQCGNRADGISVIGNAAHPNRTRIIGTISGGTTAQARDMGILFLTDLHLGCTLGAATGIGAAASQFGVLDLTRVTIVGCDNGIPVAVSETGAANIVDLTLSSNAVRFFSASGAKSKLLIAGTITCDGVVAATTNLFVDDGATDATGATWSGCASMPAQKFWVRNSGVLNTAVANGSDIPGTTAGLIDGASFGLLNAKTVASSWTPIDASGAGLTFSPATAKVSQIGNHCTISLLATYPVTADTSSAKITGFPCVATGVATGAVVSEVLSSAVGRVIDSSSTVDFFFNGAVAATNANLSGKTIRLSIGVIVQ